MTPNVYRLALGLASAAFLFFNRDIEFQQEPEAITVAFATILAFALPGLYRARIPTLSGFRLKVVQTLGGNTAVRNAFFAGIFAVFAIHSARLFAVVASEIFSAGYVRKGELSFPGGVFGALAFVAITAALCIVFTTISSVFVERVNPTRAA